VATSPATDGTSDKPDSSSNMISAFWRLALFFNCGQRLLTHCSIASSSRSLARRAGRC
jgi:hypothetical protein